MRIIPLRLAALLFPELRTIPNNEWEHALREANKESFDAIELFGAAMGFFFVMAISKYGVDDMQLEQFLMRVLANFAIAVPLLAIVLAPFFWLRMRRGLRAEIQWRSRLMRWSKD